MGKIIHILTIAVMLLAITTACNQQSDCESVVKTIIHDNKIIDINTTHQLEQQNLTRKGSIYPKFPKGNLGINPPISFFVIDMNKSNEYYYVDGGMYSPIWHGPYQGKLPTVCFYPEK